MKLEFEKMITDIEGCETKRNTHEPLHLRYPNHTKMFKSLLLSHLNKKGINANNIEL